MPDLLPDSVQGDLILEGFQLCLQELALPVLVKVAHGGAYPNHKVSSILLCPLTKVFDHVSLITEREGAAIVLSQHLQQSREVLGVSRRETPRPVDVHPGTPRSVMPPQSWGDRSDTKHSKCLLLGGQRLNQLTLIPKPKRSGGARAATAQVGPANKRNDTKRCLPIEALLRPGEAVPW